MNFNGAGLISSQSIFKPIEFPSRAGLKWEFENELIFFPFRVKNKLTNYLDNENYVP